MKLFLFTTDTDLAQKAESAGIDSIIVDWETKGKEARQLNHNMEINADTPEDVARVSQAVSIPVTVRINALGPYTSKEVQIALDHGAKILMLPMARSCEDIETFLKIVNGRAKTLIQIETIELVRQVDRLRDLPWDYAYLGLNDLSISMEKSSIWDAVTEGVVEKVFSSLKGRAYGFAGITVIGGGKPIPFSLILHEQTRLGCSVGFMRRSFKKEIMDRDIVAELKAVRSFIDTSRLRGPQAKIFDQKLFQNAVLKKGSSKDMLKNGNAVI